MANTWRICIEVSFIVGQNVDSENVLLCTGDRVCTGDGVYTGDGVCTGDGDGVCTGDGDGVCTGDGVRSMLTTHEGLGYTQQHHS